MIWAEELFLKVLNMSIVAGYCVLAVLLLRWLLRRQPRVYSYALWTVVYFRFVCPVSFRSVASLVRIDPQPIPSDVEIWGGAQGMSAQTQEAMRQAGVTLLPDMAQRASQGPSLARLALSVGTGVWIAVAVLLFAHSLWALRRLWRGLKDAVREGFEVYEANNLKTPFVFGILRPRIYLPAGLPEPERGFVLAHERTHIRRRDPFLKQAAFLVTCVHWFNPLAWVAFRLMCRDMEMSCDELVIRGLEQEERKKYSAALLSLAAGRTAVSGSPLAFGEGGIRARIAHVLGYRRPAFWMSLLFTVALSVILVGLALNPAKAEEIGEVRQAQEGEADLYEQEQTKPALAGGVQDDVDPDNFSQAVTYDGYLDESPYTAWNRDWNDCDFDADGLRDRVYRSCSAEELTVSYRIEFGNGLEISVGEFEDCFTGIMVKAGDITGDGEREILYVGMHAGSTDPLAGSEIALFTKAGDRYVQIPLPQLAQTDGGEPEPYGAGYGGLYFRENGDGTLLLDAPELGYEERFEMTEGERERWESENAPRASDVGNAAYDASFIMLGNDHELYLALFERPGDKWFEHTVCFVLTPVMSALSVSPWEMELCDAGLVGDTGLTRYRFSAEARSFEANPAAEEAQTQREREPLGTVTSGSVPEHRKGFEEPVVHLYVPSYDPTYVDVEMLSEEERTRLAVDALQDLYDLTGTQIEECFYYFTTLGDFYFAHSREDMDRQRIFLDRAYGENEEPVFGPLRIGSISYASRRRVWFSDVDQLVLPEDYEELSDRDRAVWFLEHSGLYQGETVVECLQPYSAQPETWQIRMEEGTAYELTLDNEAEGVADILGPYPDWNIAH